MAFLELASTDLTGQGMARQRQNRAPDPLTRSSMNCPGVSVSGQSSVSCPRNHQHGGALPLRCGVPARRVPQRNMHVLRTVSHICTEFLLRWKYYWTQGTLLVQCCTLLYVHSEKSLIWYPRTITANLVKHVPLPACILDPCQEGEHVLCCDRFYLQFESLTNFTCTPRGHFAPPHGIMKPVSRIIC